MLLQDALPQMWIAMCAAIKGAVESFNALYAPEVQFEAEGGDGGLTVSKHGEVAIEVRLNRDSQMIEVSWLKAFRRQTFEVDADDEQPLLTTVQDNVKSTLTADDASELILNEVFFPEPPATLGVIEYLKNVERGGPRW